MGAAAEQFIELLLDQPGIAGRIEGVVTDADGRPLADRGLTATAAKHTWRARSDGMGNFAFERRADEPKDPVHVELRLEYDHVAHPEPVAWGTSDLRIIADLGAPVEVRAVDGATGAAVRRFGVRFVPTRGAGIGYDTSRRLRGVGDHEDGRCELGAFPPDVYMLSVEAADSRYSPTPYLAVEIAHGVACTVQVELWPPAHLVCEVAAGGVPKGHSRVELLIVAGGKDGGAPAGLRPRTMPYFGSATSRYGTLLGEATTDDAGRAILEAPRGGPFAIRITGDHQPLYREGIHVDGDRELRFAVETAATLRLRVRPWPLPSHPPATLAVSPPIVTCKAVGSRETEVRGSAFDAAGVSRIEGLVPGALRVKLQLNVPDTPQAFVYPIEIEVPALGAGEVREVDVDLTRWLPVVFRARVVANGAPAAGVSLGLDVTDPADARLARVVGRTDEDGRVALGVPRGKVHGSIRLVGAQTSIPLDPFELGDDPAERTIEVSTGDVRVRVLGSDGRTPLAGIELLVDAALQGQGLTTDSDGVVNLGPTRCGPLSLRIWTRELADRSARIRPRRELLVRAVALGSRVVLAGSQSFQLIAPAESGY